MRGALADGDACAGAERLGEERGMERAKQRLAVGSVEQEGGGFGNHDPAGEPATLPGIRSGEKAALQNFRGGVGAGARSAAAETELD